MSRGPKVFSKLQPGRPSKDLRGFSAEKAFARKHVASIASSFSLLFMYVTAPPALTRRPPVFRRATAFQRIEGR